LQGDEAEVDQAKCLTRASNSQGILLSIDSFISLCLLQFFCIHLVFFYVANVELVMVIDCAFVALKSLYYIMGSSGESFFVGL
jgi:hypothetical protein